jgi:8-oxo-dGTP pyrophosphatase MutT (NUDIX family)
MDAEIFPWGDPKANLWKRENRKELAKTPIFTLVTYEMTPLRNPKPKPFYVLESKSWVNVIAITPQSEIVLVRQYRHGIHEYCLELPGGIVDESGEGAELDSAKRELAEETGYTSSEWRFIGKTSGNPAIFNNWSYTFLAWNAKKTESLNWDESEDIEIILEPIEKIPEMISKGQIHHSMMVAALGLFQFYVQR